MATCVHFRPSIRSSFESRLCSGLSDPRTVVTIEVVLKYKRRIFLRNRRGYLIDFYDINSDFNACFDFPKLSICELKAKIGQWMPGLSPSLCTQLSHRIFVYAQQVAFANARHRRLNDNNGGANKVMAFVEIEEPELKLTDNDRVQDYTGGVWADLHDDGGIVLYFSNNEESSKPPRGLSWDEINGLKQERFKNGTAAEMCSICLEEFSTGVKITPLPCSHTFHHNCIASWLQKHASCPLCRFNITQQCS
nr:probable E3 ubiquitin-protein ligase RHY1A [Ipomoea batatas]